MERGRLMKGIIQTGDIEHTYKNVSTKPPVELLHTNENINKIERRK
jgi:hypothetical protein